jgi:hypothetical protein
MSQPDILPDCRTNWSKAEVRINRLDQVDYLERVFCANCGKPAGYVYKSNTNFAFALCDPCGDTWGAIAYHMQEPHLRFEHIEDQPNG